MSFWGTNHFAGRSYYGGFYGTNNDSHYDLFSAGGQDFIVLALTMAAGSDPGLMRWANEVLRATANRQAIVGDPLPARPPPGRNRLRGPRMGR